MIAPVTATVIRALPSAAYNQMPAFDEVTLPLGDLQVDKVDRNTYTVTVEGQTMLASDRFRDSFLGQIGQGSSIFNLFGFEEVAERFRDRHPRKEKMRLVIDTTNNVALGLSQPNKPRINPLELVDLLRDHDGEALRYRYESGRIISCHLPTTDFDRQTKTLGGETLFPRFYQDCPVDGYGNPSVYIGLIREICSNGLIAMTPTFRRPITLGKEPMTVIDRCLNTFNMGDQAALELVNRLENAAATPASVREFHSLARLVGQLLGTDRRRTAEGVRIWDAVKAYNQQVCDTLEVANLNVFDEKPSARIPTEFSVYDLINMATELATHFGLAGGSRLHAWVGSRIVQNYDLEGLDLPAPSPTDFFFLDQQEQLVLAS